MAMLLGWIFAWYAFKVIYECIEFHIKHYKSY